MKALVSAVVVASALAIPALSFAQQANNGPVTRAQVKAELAAAQKDGSLYLGNSDYPGPAPQQTLAVADTSSSMGVGGSTGGTSQSGSRTPTIEQRIFATFRGN
ncbi:MAG TPA: DUF4148 domain-containing protein [Paraburkholderia sp.]|jgi:hypothetical protein|nr:DUF4148 domain-containing protein [Paraburkholderia sp.]